jgi:hypothetical protein
VLEFIGSINLALLIFFIIFHRIRYNHRGKNNLIVSSLVGTI